MPRLHVGPRCRSRGSLHSLPSPVPVLVGGWVVMSPGFDSGGRGAWACQPSHGALQGLRVHVLTWAQVWGVGPGGAHQS